MICIMYRTGQRNADIMKLLQKIEGEEEVEKMDALLSLAITGGDCNWI